MDKPFKNILIPVDFTFNTELAINKGVQLIDVGQAAIHLVHVMKPHRKDIRLFKTIPADRSHKNRRPAGDEIIDKLLAWKKSIKEVRPEVKVYVYLMQGKSIEDVIASKAAELIPELIIIGKHTDHRWLPFLKNVSPVKLARKTHCAVLTAKPGSLHTKIRSIVLPVRASVPIRKLELLIPLAWKQNTTVYLLSILNDTSEYNDSSVSNTLVETFRLLKEKVNCQVAHKLIKGNNAAKTTLQFAEEVNADILLVNPDETRVSSFTGLDISDMVLRNSKLQVLAIDPQTGKW